MTEICVFAEESHQSEAKSKQFGSHKAMILWVRHVCLSITNRVPKPLLPLFSYLVKMLQSPADEGGDVRHKGLPAGGEAVLNSRRHFGINLPADKSYLFKPFERLREHLLGTIGHIMV